MKKFFTFLLLLVCVNLNAQTKVYMGSWSGVIESVGLEIVFNVGEESSTFDVPGEGAKGLELVVSETLTGVRFDIPAIMAYFEGVYFNKSIVGNFVQNGGKYPMSLKPYVATAPKRPQTPQEPFAYKTEEVSFTNGDARLAGTMVLPEGATLDTPVLLFVTGSGAQDRNEEIVEHKPFWVLADAFANAGFPSLRYDDRGFALSTGDRLRATTDTLALDALAGVKYLRSLGYKKIGVIGHSEGGTIAFMLAAKGEVDFIISLAGMAENGEATLRHQTVAIAKAQGANEAQAKAASEASVEQMRGQGVWAIRFLELDPTEFLKDIKCPVLALNGENDKNVICERNIPLIRELVPQAKIITYPGLNHLFQPSNNGTASEYYSIETTFEPAAIEDIIKFLKNIE